MPVLVPVTISGNFIGFVGLDLIERPAGFEESAAALLTAVQALCTWPEREP
jgi:hypothetical protein